MQSEECCLVCKEKIKDVTKMWQVYYCSHCDMFLKKSELIAHAKETCVVPWDPTLVDVPEEEYEYIVCNECVKNVRR